MASRPLWRHSNGRIYTLDWVIIGSEIDLSPAQRQTEAVVTHCPLDHYEQILWKIESKYKSLSINEMSVKYHLLNIATILFSVFWCDLHCTEIAMYRYIHVKCERIDS